MPYSNMQEIINDFDLKTDDISIILNNMKEIRKDTHPDKTQGEFADEESKNLYTKVSDAITFIEDLKGNSQLLVVQQMTTLVKAFAETIPGQRYHDVQNRLESKIDNLKIHYKSKLSLPKITLTGVTGILSFIVLFPTQFDENPALKGKINFQDPMFFYVWLNLILVTLSLWYYTYKQEESVKKILESLKVESNQNKIFRDFLGLHGKTFSKDELIHFIHRNDESRYRSIRFEEITIDICQAVAESIVSRGERNGILVKNISLSFSDSYTVNADLIV